MQRGLARKLPIAGKKFISGVERLKGGVHGTLEYFAKFSLVRADKLAKTLPACPWDNRSNYPWTDLPRIPRQGISSLR